MNELGLIGTHELSYSQLNRLQQIQNCLACAVFKAPKFTRSLTPLLFLNLYTGSKSISVLSIKFFLLHIKFLLLLNLATSEIWSLLTRLMLKLVLHLLLPSLDHYHLPSLKITDRSFRYASLCLWNKLPASLRQPNPDHSFSHSSQPNCLSSSVPSSPLSLSITPSLFHSKLKRYLFLKSFLPLYPTPSIGLPLRTPDCSMVFFLVFFPLTF